MQLGWHFAIPRVHNSAVVIVRTIEMLRSKWHKHTRWLGRTKEQMRSKENKREKGVEPYDHCEVTCGHELYPHELASVSSMMVVP